MDFTMIIVFYMSSAFIVAFGNSDVRQPPDLQAPTQPDLATYYLQGDDLRLPCRATGSPPPTYQWLKNNQNLDRLNTVMGPSGDVIIRKATPDDEGVYQCVVTNKWGTAISPTFTRIMARFDGNFGQRETSRNATRGQFVKLVPSLVPGAPTPHATWRIRYGDVASRPIMPTRRFVQDDQGSLYITDIEGGFPTPVFISESSNDLLKVKKEGGSIRIKVLGEEAPATKPVLEYPASDEVITALEGEDLRLQCIFSGRDVDVFWPQHPKATTEESGTRLIIHDINKEAAGDYSCVGKNHVGETRHVIKVRVQARPRFTSNGHLTSQTRTEGEDAIFVCDVTADPPAGVQWFINGKPVTGQTLPPRTRLSADNMALTFERLDRDKDLRVVQCNVSNEHGDLYANAALNVLMRTKLTTRLQDILLDTNVPVVRFTCNATTDPGTPLTADWWRNDRPLTFYDDSRMLVDGSTLKINLTGLEEREVIAYRGKYVCEVSNGFTSDRSTAVLSFNTTLSIEDPLVEAPPRVLPQWLLIVIAAVFALILVIAILISCSVSRRNRGAKYPVALLEERRGMDIKEEIEKEGFHTYQRPTPQLARMESICSLDSGTWHSTPKSATKSVSSFNTIRSGASSIFTFSQPQRKRSQIEVIYT